jgi:hypothetical protein
MTGLLQAHQIVGNCSTADCSISIPETDVQSPRHLISFFHMSFLLRLVLLCKTNSVVAGQGNIRNSTSVEALIGKAFAEHELR